MRNIDLLNLIERQNELFKKDLIKHESTINDLVEKSTFLVIGAAGSIGQAVTKEIFKRNPILLHAVDINENNMVELVRDIRSSMGYIKGEFKTYAIDCASREFEILMSSNAYDYVLNLSALKHVRSEKDPLTLMRMIDVNILNTLKTLKLAKNIGVKKYFCVSSDKAANPANMMGASKKLMELFLSIEDSSVEISTARFANVAFSDGSLPHGFIKRIEKKQPISAPNDVTRYFVSPEESGQICLLACILGNTGEIFFPKLRKEQVMTFSNIAVKLLKEKGYDLDYCSSEEEAIGRALNGVENKYPVYFSGSNTTGEKPYEEFYTDEEEVSLERYKALGVVVNLMPGKISEVNKLINVLDSAFKNAHTTKEDIVNIMKDFLVNFDHKELGKSLDSKM